jgi:hypothetical protein
MLTTYTLFYAMAFDEGSRPDANSFEACVSPAYEFYGDFYEMECAPINLRDSAGRPWLYRFYYAFILTAENPLGRFSTNLTVLSMDSILRTSPVTGLGLGGLAGGGVSASNPITWGRPAAPRVSPLLDPLVARVIYSPIGCPAAYSLDVRNISMSRDGGLHRPTGLTPGLRYNVSVAVRPVASLKWPLDVYWSDPSFFEATTPDAPPTAAPVFSFLELSIKMLRTLPISWKPVPCESRGTTGAVTYEVRVRSLVGGVNQGNATRLDQIFELWGQPHHYYVFAGELLFTEYSVEARARNSAGAGPWSDALFYRIPGGASA